MKCRELKLRVCKYYIHEHESYIYRIKNGKLQLLPHSVSIWRDELYIYGIGQEIPSIEQREHSLLIMNWKLVPEEVARLHMDAIRKRYAEDAPVKATTASVYERLVAS